MNTQTMTQISDDAFARLVADEVKNKLTPQRRAVLLQQENWDRWKRALLALINNLENQVQSISEDADADAERYGAMGTHGAKLAKEAASTYDGRKTRVEKFLFHVNRRLDEVMKMIETGEELESSPWHAAETYRTAISKHKDLMIKFDIEPTNLDRALWATLDKRWEMDNVVIDDDMA
jgi:hypothetical protein